MTIVFACPACGRTVSADAEPGEGVRCPLCDSDIKVPPPGMETAPLEVEPPSSELAVGALACGILGTLTCLPPLGFVGVILGIKAYNRAKEHPRRFTGSGYAIAGIVMGLLSSVSFVLVVAMFPPYEGRPMSPRTICMANQRGIGQAFYIYAQDAPFLFPMTSGVREENDGAFVAFDPQMRTNASQPGDLPSPTVDLWMVVRANDTTPKQFICPESKDVQDPVQDTTLYYDFASAQNLSYAYQYQHDPDRDPLGPNSEPTFPILADANPYIKGGITTQISLDRLAAGRGNSRNHPKREGQNVLFVDGHITFERSPDAGLNGPVSAAIKKARGKDNIYTTHKPGGSLDPGDAAPTLVGTRGTCNLGSKSDACLIP